MDKQEIQQLALNSLLPHKRAGVCISMGVGKTLLGLMHMEKFYTDYLKVLVVAPKLSVFESWKDEIVKFKKDILLDHINFTTYLSLNKEPLDYDIVYLDESHNIKESHEEWLSNYDGRIVGLTGTPSRDFKRLELADEYFPTCYTYLIDDAVADGLLNDYRIFVHTLKLDTNTNIRKESKNGKVWYTSEKAEYDYWNRQLLNASSGKQSMILRIMRMKALQGFLSKENLAIDLMEDTLNKVIVFANTMEQADRVCKHSVHSGNENSEENLKAFKEGGIMQLSAVLQLSEGVNIPNLKEGIIMHSYGNEKKFAQRLGRIMRLFPNELATIHVLCYENTVDEDWVNNSLDDFDPNKITWL